MQVKFPVGGGTTSPESAKALRLAQLRAMPWKQLAKIIGSGNYGALAKQVYMQRLPKQSAHTPPQVFYGKDNPHAHDPGAAVSGGPQDHNITQAKLNAQAAASNKPKGPAGGPHPLPKGLGTGGNSGGGGAMPADFTSMLASLLKNSSTGSLIPTSLAANAAAPATAQAATFQNEINQLPGAKAQALANISNWYGQVGKSEKQAAGQDQSTANALSSAMQGNAQGIMGSIGGSANPGAASIGAMGANNANTEAAIGANDASLADQLAPIFALAQAGAKATTNQQFTQGGQQLQDQLAQAQGQGSADKATALMQILGANNSTRQSNFSNRAGLLNTLASLQISGLNSQSQAQSRSISDALHVSEIQKNNAKTATAGSPLAGLSDSDRTRIANALNGMLMDPNTGKLKGGLAWPQALSDVRNYLRTQGLNPLSKPVVQQFVSPTLSNAGISFTNPNAIFQP